MENMNTSADNLQVQQVTDDHLERVVQDFNEFRAQILQSSSTGAMKLEELLDLYICSGGDKSSLTNAMKLEELVDLYICNGGDNMDTLTAHDASGQLTAFSNYYEGPVPTQGLDSTKAQGNDYIIEETADQDTSHDPLAENLVTYISYGDLNCHETAVRVIGSVLGGDIGLAFGSVARFFNTNRTETKKRVKRKYKKRAVKALPEK